MEAGDTKRNKVCLSLELSERVKVIGFKPKQKDKMIVQDDQKLVTLLDVCMVMSSLLTYAIDTITDLLVAAQYFNTAEYVFGSLSVAFVVAPAVVIQVFSGRWYAADGKMRGCRYWVLHLLLLQPLERYLFVVVSGLEARRTKHPDLVSEFYHQHNDVSMLRLFEAFLESAPQLTLQVYVILYTSSANWLTVTSACVSMLAVGWAVAAYSHALRKAYRDSYTVFWPSLLVQTLWHMGVVAGRVLALVLFTSVFKYWVCLVIGAHWLVMSAWIILQNTDFCPSRWEELMFDATVGLVYNFSFFNLKEGRSRCRISAYYAVMLAENAALVTVWWLYRPRVWYDLPLLVATAVTFVVGLVCMALYYRYCHPSGPIPCVGGEPVDRSLSKCEPETEEVLGLPLTRAPTYQSTPAARQTQGVVPVAVDPQLTPRRGPRTSTTSLPPRGVPPGPRTSTCSLPRRALLKSQLSSRLDVEYHEVATPSHLSPIKAYTSPLSRNVYPDVTSLQLEDADSEYCHFSVDASACLYESHCRTLEGSGVDLSRAGMLGDEHAHREGQRDTQDTGESLPDDVPNSPCGSSVPDSPCGTNLPDSPCGTNLSDTPCGSSLPDSPFGNSLPDSPFGSSLPDSPCPSSVVDSPAMSEPSQTSSCDSGHGTEGSPTTDSPRNRSYYAKKRKELRDHFFYTPIDLSMSREEGFPSPQRISAPY